MTQGIFINGSRPKTKKQLKEQITSINNGEGDPYSVVIEATSMFGNEFDGSLAKAMNCNGCHRHSASTYSEDGPLASEPAIHPETFYLVGPDPYNKRNWYASLQFDPDKERWIIK